MKGYNLPAVVELLEVHRGVPHHLLVGTREIDRPPSKGECEVRLEELDLNATGFDEPHRTTIRIPVNVQQDRVTFFAVGTRVYPVKSTDMGTWWLVREKGSTEKWWISVRAFSQD